MSGPSIEAVVAGTKAFAIALLAPLTTRLGTRPRVAADPAQAASLCGPSGLVVVEYVGEVSLAAIDRLVNQAGLRVVAGVPAEHAAAEAALRALGVEPARWDGRPDAVLSAVDRALAGAGPVSTDAAAVSPAPVVAPKPSPPNLSRSAAAVAAPRLTAAAPAVAKPPPVAAPVARPAGSAPAPAATRPAAPAVNRTTPAAKAPALAPPAVPAPAGAASPAPRLAAVPAPRPAAAPAPRLAAAPAPRPAAAPAAAVVRAPARPAPQAPVVPAPSRPAPPPGAAAAPTVARPVAVVPARAVAAAIEAPAVPADADVTMAPPPSRPPASFFDDLRDDAAFEIDTDDVAVVGAVASRIVAMAPPVDRGPWPSDAPTDAEAEAALARGLAGTYAGVPLGDVVAQVVVALSDLERNVLGGAPQPFDATPIRRAAIMRVRVAGALAAAPALTTPVDTAGVSALLGEIDALLSDVGALLGAAPAELQPALETVRNALVKEAIDFSEAAQRAASGPATAAEATRPVESAASRRAAATVKVLSMHAGMERPEPPRNRGLWVVFLLVALTVGGYHGWRLFGRLPPAPPATFAGAPGGTMGTDRGTSRVLSALPGRQVDPAELERFKAAEQAKGNVVQEIAPGSWVIERASAGQGERR